MAARHPDDRGGGGGLHVRVQLLRARRAEIDPGGAEVGHHALALAAVPDAGRGAGHAPADNNDDHQLLVAGRDVRRRLVHLPADLLGPAARDRGPVRTDVRLGHRRPLGVRVVHRDGVGHADPGPAQPDDPLADDRHRPPRPLALQRRPDRPGPVMTGMIGSSQLKAARLARRSETPQAPRKRTAWAGAARQHWLAVALLCAGLVLRVLAGLAYRPALFYIDTTRYLYNADGMDPVGYKGLLRAILLVGNFDAVAAVQHLLGLAMAAAIYLLLR